MNKPVVFFSHSSRDREYVNFIRDKLLEKSSSSIQVFSSSDGQSIDFGTNWLSSIEDALAEATTGFVFLSQNSLDSDWIYFETGFLYGRKMRITPIGIMGTDLGALRPPLSILQGFNIRNYEGLNNIVEVINRQYKLTIKKDFTAEDFRKLSEFDTFATASELGFIDYLTFRFNLPKASEVEPALESALASIDQDVERKVAKNSIEIIGARIEFVNDPFSPSMSIKIAPSTLSRNWKTLGSIIRSFVLEPEPVRLSASLKKGFSIVTDSFQISSRLRTKISLGQDHYLKFRDLEFHNDTSYRPGGSGLQFAGYHISLRTNASTTFPEDFTELMDIFGDLQIVEFTG